MNCRVRKAFDKKTIQASFTGHLTGLPQDILALFQPGPPLPHLEVPKKKKKILYDLGIASYVEQLEPSHAENLKPSGTHYLNIEYQHQVRLPETLLEMKRRNEKEKKDRRNAILVERIKTYNPTLDPNVEGDPFKTLFVARLSYEVTERTLRKEFEDFGSISRTRIVTDKLSGKPRGYAFIEFNRAEDMKRAYKLAMNRKIWGRRVVVDVERGRTVAEWKPRRLGGGLGGETRLRQNSILDSTLVVAQKLPFSKNCLPCNREVRDLRKPNGRKQSPHRNNM